MLQKTPRILTTLEVGILTPVLKIKNLGHKDIEGPAKGNVVVSVGFRILTQIHLAPDTSIRLLLTFTMLHGK